MVDCVSADEDHELIGLSRNVCVCVCSCVCDNMTVVTTRDEQVGEIRMRK